MPGRGIPLARDARLAHATNQAKRMLLQTKSWYRARAHTQQFLRITYALSANTVRDYLTTIELRLCKDPETKKFMDPTIMQYRPGPPPAEFISASDMADDESTTGKV